MPIKRIHVGQGREKTRRGSQFYIRWRDPVTGAYAKLFYPTRSEALAKRNEKLLELNSPPAPRSETPFAQVVIEWAESLNKKRSEKYRRDIDRVVANFVDLTEPRTIADLSTTAVQKFMHLREQGLPPRTVTLKNGEVRTLPIVPLASDTVRREYAILYKFARWCVKRDYLAKNPLDTIEKPDATARHSKPPRPSEWVKLLEVLPQLAAAQPPEIDDAQAWHLLILLAAVTSQDQSVLLAAQPGHFTLDIDRSNAGLFDGRRTKTSRRGLVGLPPALAERVAQRIACLPEGAKLFPWGRFQRKQFVKIARAAGFSHTFQDLRASGGTLKSVNHAVQAGAAHLLHSGTEVARRHYLDMEEIHLAAARAERLPELPALPAYTPYLSLPRAHSEYWRARSAARAAQSVRTESDRAARARTHDAPNSEAPPPTLSRSAKASADSDQV